MTSSTTKGAGEANNLAGGIQMLSVADVLDKAADLIEPEGAWCQCQFDNGAGGHCAVGAILAVSPSIPLRAKAVNVAQDAVDGLIMSFNDAPGRTQAEVVNALREAANLSRQGGGHGA